MQQKKDYKKPYNRSSSAKPYNKNRDDRDGGSREKNSREGRNDRDGRVSEKTQGFQNFRENVNSQKTPLQAHQKNKFELKKTHTLCSFVILENCEINIALETIGNLLQYAEKIAISIHETNFEKTKALILENFEHHKESLFFVKYNTYSFEIHNQAFKLTKSDIFLIIHSGFAPRDYSIEILKKYLQKENTLASVPTVYNAKGQIQKYSVRILTLAMKLKMFFSSNAKTAYIMMERGETGYYKIHKIPATLAPFAVNSKAFAEIGGFEKTKDEESSRFTFFKKLNKHGVASFVPTARFVEMEAAKPSVCFVTKLCYFIKNIF